MSKNNTVWLSNFHSAHFMEVYGIQASFPGILDAKEFYFLNEKDDDKTLSVSEKEQF